jgi:hypothetical protein
VFKKGNMMAKLLNLPKFTNFDKTRLTDASPIKFTHESIELPVDGSNRELLIIDDAEPLMLRGLLTNKARHSNRLVLRPYTDR